MRKLQLMLGVFLLVGLWSSSALALSRRGRATLRNVKAHIRISRMKVVKRFERGPVTRGVIAHYKNLNSNLDRAIRTFNRIRGRDRRDPEVVRVGNKLRALSVHFQIIKRRVNRQAGANKAEKRLFFDFKRKFGGHKYYPVIQKLNELNVNPRSTALVWILDGGGAKRMHKKLRKRRKSSWRKKGPAMPGVGSAFQEFKRKVRKIRRACNGRFRGVTNLRHYSHSLRTQYATWCMLVNKAKPLIRRGIHNAVKNSIKFMVKRLDDGVDSLLNKKGFMHYRSAKLMLYPAPARLKIKAKIARYSQITGIQLDDSKVLARWDSLVAKARGILFKKAKGYRLKDIYRKRPGRLKRKVKREINRNWKRARFRKVRAFKRRWLIVKHGLTGIPLRRVRSGVALYKMKGERFCRAKTFEYKEVYKGRGRYSRRGTFHWSNLSAFSGVDKFLP